MTTPIRAWFGRQGARLGRLWSRLPLWVRRLVGFVMSWPGRLWRSLRSWTGQEWLVVATLVIAVLGYWQWRYNNVLELQKRWASPEMTARQQRLIDAHSCTYVPAILSSDERRQTNAALTMIQSSEGYEGIEEDLPVFVEFFGEVEICIKMGLCDKSTACERFGPQAINLHGYYGQYLSRMRRLTQEDIYSGQFTRVAEMCGLGDQLRPPSNRPWTREQLDEVARLRREWEDNGPVAARSRQACERMRPGARQLQSRPAQ